jgi:hypothetical protein
MYMVLVQVEVGVKVYLQLQMVDFLVKHMGDMLILH